MTKVFNTLGERVTQFQGFETFPPKSGHVSTVTFTIPDVASVCPITSQPDFSFVEIVYWPGEKMLETKTLKLYLETFRDKGIFCEDLAEEICEDLWKALDPIHIHVNVTQRMRGGIITKAEAVRGA